MIEKINKSIWRIPFISSNICLTGDRGVDPLRHHNNCARLHSLWKKRGDHRALFVQGCGVFNGPGMALPEHRTSMHSMTQIVPFFLSMSSAWQESSMYHLSIIGITRPMMQTHNLPHTRRALWQWVISENSDTGLDFKVVLTLWTMAPHELSMSQHQFRVERKTWSYSAVLAIAQFVWLRWFQWAAG